MKIHAQAEVYMHTNQLQVEFWGHLNFLRAAAGKRYILVLDGKSTYFGLKVHTFRVKYQLCTGVYQYIL